MSTDLKPWYAVATPHEDIRKGRLEEAVFAANIWAVVQKTAPEVYLDAEEFYRKTYMTAGLCTVLSRVAKALKGGEAGDRIISLQTAFGGGKTHALVALWHLARHMNKLRKSEAGEALRKCLGKDFPEKPCTVSVFTNSVCDATQGRRTSEGVHTRTLWGEIALQLGGKKLYEKVRANDEAQRVPQGLFVDIFKAASPCLVLLDELADYCIGAAAVPVGDTTLADQTISFIQQLEEAAAQVPGVVIVATLPASRIEVAQSEKGQELFAALEKRFQRLGADIKPVADDEIYEVVRARLFESVAPESERDYPAKVAGAYHKMYSEHSGEVATEATKTQYREAIERAYPFHPQLIDALHTRWGSHPDFQRTRGVLRLLGSIVGDLWQRRQNNTQSQPLIQPCHVRWSIDALQAALVRLWGLGFQSVSAADVIGENSNARLFDEERGGDYQRERIGEGLASAILLGSFGGQGQRSGFSAKDLKLGCARPNINWAYSDGALLELENRCFYLHTAAAGSLGKRYWFGAKPTLNKLVVQYRSEMSRKDFDAEILDALTGFAKSGTGAASWRLIVDPGEELAEQKSLALIILPPAIAWNGDEKSQQQLKDRVRALSTKCGGRERLYRNTLVFLAPNARGMTRLRNAYRESAALHAVQTDYGSQLDDTQRDDLRKRIEQADRAAAEALGPAFSVALRVDAQDIETTVLSDARSSFTEHLDYLSRVLIEDEEWILRRVGSVMLQKSGLIVSDGGIAVKDAVDAFLRFTDKPMIISKEAVTTGLEQACKDGLIGIGRGPSLGNLQARYCRELVTLDATEEGLWIIPPFARETTAPEGPGSPGERGERPEPMPPGETPTPDVSGEQPRKIVRRISIKGNVPSESWADLFRSFISPAVRISMKKVQLGITFELEPGDAIKLAADDPRVKSMVEAARQLGLDIDITE